MKTFTTLAAVVSIFTSVCTSAQTTWKSIESGGASLGIKSDGSLWAWGPNFTGQLGIAQSGTFSATTPMQVTTGGNNWKAVSSGYSHCLGIQRDGSLWAWGDNTYGELGGGKMQGLWHPYPVSAFYDSVPVLIDKQHEWIAATAGQFFSLGIQKDGSLWAWGLNSSGQLGIGNQDTSKVPVRVGKENKWVKVSAGKNHVLALQSDGSLWAWGDNSSGELGLGSETPSLVLIPTRVKTNANNWTSVSAGSLFSLAILKDSSLWTWGIDIAGLLGKTTPAGTIVSPRQVTVDCNNSLNRNACSNKWLAIDAGGFAIGIQKSRTTWVWGGSLGCPNSPFPIPITYLSSSYPETDSTWTSISAGADYALALKKVDTAFYSYGYGNNGNLGKCAGANSRYCNDIFVSATNVLPVILKEPSSGTVCAGTNAIFRVSAGQGSTYQWLENNVPLSNGGVYEGVNTPDLIINKAPSSLNGKTYACRIVGRSCTSTPISVTSLGGVLTVLTPPCTAVAK